MAKFAELPDGTKLEFPDETPDSIIDSTVKRHLGVQVEEPSQLKAFAKQAIEETPSALGGFAAGVAAGAPAWAIGGPWTGIPAMILGGVGGAMATRAAQDKLTEFVPEDIKEATGFDPTTRQAEREAHPYTSFAGGLAPNLLVGKPGALPNIVTQGGKVIGSGVQRAGAAGLGGGFEAGQQLVSGEELDPYKIAMSAAVSGVAAKNTGFGNWIESKVTPSGLYGNKVGGQQTPDPDAEIASRDFGLRADNEVEANNIITGNLNKIQEIQNDIIAQKAKKAAFPNMSQEQRDRIDTKIVEGLSEISRLGNENTKLNQWLGTQQAGGATPQGATPPGTPGAPAATAVNPNAATTQVTPTTVTQQAHSPTSVVQQQVSDLEVQMSEIKAQWQAENSKGAVRDTAKMQELEAQYNKLADEAEALTPKAFGEDNISPQQTQVSEVDRIKAELEAAKQVKGKTTQEIMANVDRVVELERQLVEAVGGTYKDTHQVHQTFNDMVESNAFKNPVKLENALKRKEDLLNKLQAQRDERFDPSEVIANLQSEIKTLRALKDKLDSGAIKPSDIIEPDLSKVTTPEEYRAAVLKGLDQTIQLGNMRAGLMLINRETGSSVLRTITNALLNNKTIGKFTKLAYANDLQMKGAEASLTQTAEGSTMHMNQSKKLTQTNFVHEAVHAATSGMMKAFSMGYTKFTPEAKLAMTRISDLHARLRADHFDYIVDQHAYYLKTVEGMDPVKAYEQATKDVNEFLKNDRELLAYGMTLEPFMKTLDSIKFFGKPALSQMYDDISKTLGSVDPQMNSALRELLKDGEMLLRQSEGKGLAQFGMHTEDTLDNVRSYRTVNGDIGTTAKEQFMKRFLPNTKSFWQGTKKLGLYVLSPHAFARFFNHPHIDAVTKIVSSADKQAQKTLNDVMNGVVSAINYGEHLKNSILIPMQKAKGELLGKRGLEYAFNNISNKELVGIIPHLKKAFAERVDLRQTGFPGMTPDQKMFLEEFYRASDVIYAADAARAQKAGHPVPTYVPGYFLKSNFGSHIVEVMGEGVVLKRIYQNSSAAAKELAQHLQRQDSTITVGIREKDPFTDYSGLVNSLEDIRSDLQANPNLDAATYIQGKIETINLLTDQVGGHHMHRGFAGGFAGDTGGTVYQMANEFKDGVLSSVREYTKAMRAREIATNYAYLISGSPNTPPANIAEVGRFFIDHHLGRAANNPVAKGVEKHIEAPINDAINNAFFALFGKAPQHNVIESVWNNLSRLGYMMTLTTAPVTWVAQMASVMNSMRMSAQLGANPIKATIAGFSGIGKTIFKSYDADALAGLQHIAQNTDLFHKTIAHDIQTKEGMSTFGGKHEGKTKLLTGEMQTEWSDSFSRVASWRIAMEILKDQGITGKDAWNKAADIMTENLMPMGRQHLPRMYKELGFIGTAIAPLKSYTHGLASNLAADIKQVGSSVAKGDLKGISKDSYILAMNVMAIMLQGGLLGAPFLADYEWLRQQGVKAGFILPDTLPNYTQFASNQPEWLSRGALSALTGGNIDIGSSNRYRSIFEPVAEASSINIMASMPLSVTAGAIGGATTIVKDMFGNVADPRARAAWDKVLPRGPARAIKEEIYAAQDPSGMVPFGQRGEALVERGTPERIAKVLGSSSMEEAKARTRMNDMEINKDAYVQVKQKASDLLASNNEKDKEAGRNLVKRIAEGENITYKEALKQVINLKWSQYKTREDRGYTNKKGQLSTIPQARNLRDLMEYGEP